MNPILSTAETDACLEILYRGLVSIRIAAQDGNMARVFLEPLAESYPDLARLGQPLDEMGR